MGAEGTEEMDTEEVKSSAAEAPVPETPSMAVRLGAQPLGGEFTPQEQQVLASLRNRYQQGHDQFSGRELAHMRFLQWLYRGGRLDS